MKKISKKKCQRKLSTAQLHQGLGRILAEEKTNRNRDAREEEDQRRTLPKSSQIPYLP